METINAQLEQFRRDPGYSPTLVSYLRAACADDGVCLSRKEFIEDRPWYASPDYRVIQATFRVDHILWCFRKIPGAREGEYTGVVLNRGAGARDFGPRERTLVREAQAALTPLIGGPLARYADPSPLGLPPRARQVLACMLEGDGDKQIALRLTLGAHTVNQYAKAIYRHFGVRSRPQLLARWIRRGWGVRPWAD